VKRRTRQQTLAAQTGFEKYGRKTKGERFLEEMEQVVPWAELQGLVEWNRTIRRELCPEQAILKRQRVNGIHFGHSHSGI
jgi:hypothetical protein